MSWHCPDCGAVHARQYDRPTTCDKCEVAAWYEHKLTRIAAIVEESDGMRMEYLSSQMGAIADVLDGRRATEGEEE